MVRGEFTDLLDSLHRAAGTGSDLSAAPADEAARLLRLDALTLALRSRRGALELLWADPADPFGPELEDMQYTLGEGPTLDAARTRRTVIETDLGAAPGSRWPLFAPAACRTPARAVIAVPLLLGAATAGVLTGYRTAPGPFPERQYQDFARFARVALELLLHTPTHALADGTQGPDLHRAAVHQAAGMLTAQLDVSIDEALVRLRAHAWRHDLPLLHVARAIVSRRLRLSPDR
ncbi:GAF and ANTAR domain-containing protein [Streptomyces rimosus]|uniref:GAF and ANTAR domain-containing protein n=1 Tax=Streptomyces rimosus TaxID=1927 RepID=UPI00067E5546|nr:GAF and ANTAR domain-containing protein [Streptomyces rimosus]